jgi:molybdopterin-biosynthesis enzyme MoeA-like protein
MFHEPPIYLKKIYVNEAESRIAPLLNVIVKRYQEVKIGSYPVLDNADYSVMVNLESLDASSLSSAFSSLLENIPKDKLFKAEG